MTAIVVDTSVVVKWYIPEQHHRKARELRDVYLDGQIDLVAPALMPFETANALRYSGHYDDDRLTEAMASLGHYGVELVPFSECGPVGRVAQDCDITVYDAAYITLAQSRDTTAYTADGRLLDDLTADYDQFGTHIQSF